MMYRIWNIALPQPKIQERLSKSLNISSLLAQLLINRKITTVDDAEKFLKPELSDISSPFELKGVDVACQRIKRAAESKEKIMIFGDYDTDGITAVAILNSVLKRLGIQSRCYLPHRINEGYGLNSGVIKIAKENNIQLLITVDCGITNFSEVEQLNRQGIDVIITDHHLSLDKHLPKALAIINPKLQDNNSAYKELAGVGVAYKLASALLENQIPEYLDLVCLGTVGDNVDLLGENRIIVKHGLKVLSFTERPGLRALMEGTGINKEYLDTFDIGYILSPRINACGRIDSACFSLQLLLTDSEQEAESLAKQLNQMNYFRQRIEEKILREATALIEQDLNFKDCRVIVLANEGWHEGVLGIIASRIKDMFHRPTVLISLKQDFCRGSARSIKNFHIMEALSECRDILKNFGGHRLAAGLSILKENIEIFKERLNQLARQKLNPEDIQPSLEIDMELKFKDLSDELLEEIEKLRPFGEGNPEPLFYTPRLKLRTEPVVLGNDTLKLWVTDGEFTYRAVGFNMREWKNYLSKVDSFDLVYSLKPTKNNYESNFELKIADIRLGPVIP